jgi:prepilin-type N-terminal cleavage/methylation domain-containing protein
MRGRVGVTLVELMVVLVLLGLLASVAVLDWRRSSPPSPPDEGAIAVARQRALATGTTVRLEVTTAGGRVAIAALPDGSLIGVGKLRLDPLTGRRGHDAR